MKLKNQKPVIQHGQLTIGFKKGKALSLIISSFVYFPTQQKHLKPMYL